MCNSRLLYCALAAAQCIVCNRSCLFVCVYVCVGGWVYYHDNSKLHASIGVLGEMLNNNEQLQLRQHAMRGTGP